MSETLNPTGYFTGQDKRRLFYQSWKIKNPKGIAFITHGLSENSDRYDRLARFLNKDGWNVYAWDLRGHGRSSGVRGYIRKFRLFERDLVHFAHFILKKEKNLPYVFIGHSLGALVMARALYHEEDLILKSSAICLLAPALGLKLGISLFKLIIVFFTYYLFPKLVYYNEILATHLTRDPYFQNIIKNDPFRHNKVSPEIYLSVLRNPKFMDYHSSVTHPRLLIQMAGADVVVDNKEVQKYYDQIQVQSLKKLIIYPSSMHQILEDYDYKKVIQDLRNYIQPLIG